MLARIKAWARSLKRDIAVVWLAARDPRTPVLAKALAIAIAAYALSPIDLIPDFVPVLGLLDDIVIVPLGLMLVVRMIPHDLVEDLRDKAVTQGPLPKSKAGLAIMIVIWILACVAAVYGLAATWT